MLTVERNIEVSEQGRGNLVFAKSASNAAFHRPWLVSGFAGLSRFDWQIVAGKNAASTHCVPPGVTC